MNALALRFYLMNASLFHSHLFVSTSPIDKLYLAFSTWLGLVYETLV